jgi:hypothetical protein
MAALLLMAAGLAAADSASAQQQFPFEGPFTPIIASPLYSGRFYFQGGVRFRLLYKFQFTNKDHALRYENPGVPPFGPNQEGPFGSGTGIPGFPLSPSHNPADDPDVSGYWIYENGDIDARAPTDPDAQFNYCWGTEKACNNNTLQTGPLGHYPSADPVADPNGANIGSFEVSDTTSQMNSGTVNTTTRISWRRPIDGTYPVASGEVPSRIVYADIATWKRPDFQHTAWAPSIEAGFQLDDYFDLYWSLSWIYQTDRFTRSDIVQSYLRRRGFQDTYSLLRDRSSHLAGVF